MPSVNAPAPIQTTSLPAIQPGNNKELTLHGYIEKITEKFSGPEAKVAETFANTTPIENTPSAEKIDANNPAARPASLSSKELKPIIKQVGNNGLTGKIVKLFGDVDAFNIPKLEWKDSFHAGGTGYVDGIKPSDMSHSVMAGIDQWNRLFVAVKTTAVNEDGTTAGVGVETLFQRYTNSDRPWTSGSHHALRVNGTATTIITSTMGDEEYARFEQLVKGEKISIHTWKGPASVKLAHLPLSAKELQPLINTVGKDSLTGKIVKIFGGIEAFNIPKLDWKESFHAGGTGYVDGIKPADMTHSVMAGIDRWKRLFVAVKTTAVNENGTTAGIGVETFFQRYYDSGHIWASGSHHALRINGYPHTVITSRMGDEEYARFEQLVKGEKISTRSWTHFADVKLA